MNDPIVEETRKIRDQIASQFKYDIQALGKHFQRQQALSSKDFVTRPPKRPHSNKTPEIA